MTDWNFTDFAAPFPDTREDADLEKKELVAEIIMLRDQIDAVAEGDAQPPHSGWVFEATSYRRKVQSRCNRLNHHIKTLPPRQNEQTIRDEQRRIENEQRKADAAKVADDLARFKEAEKTKRQQIAAESAERSLKLLKKFVRSELGEDVWKDAKAAMNAAEVTP